MKKIYSILLVLCALLLVVCLASCDGQQTPNVEEGTTESTEITENTTDAVTTEDPNGNETQDPNGNETQDPNGNETQAPDYDNDKDWTGNY